MAVFRPLKLVSGTFARVQSLLSGVTVALPELGRGDPAHAGEVSPVSPGPPDGGEVATVSPGPDLDLDRLDAALARLRASTPPSAPETE